MSNMMSSATNMMGNAMHAMNPANMFASGSDNIKVGDSLTSFPGYTKPIPATEGGSISLSQYKNEKSVVVFFFPKASTNGCDREVCAFRDQYDKFQAAGAQVLGISSDSIDHLKKYAQEQKAQFPFLGDKEGMLRKDLHVSRNMMMMLPGRETIVISKEGVVLLRFNDGLHVEKHVQEALKALQHS